MISAWLELVLAVILALTVVCAPPLVLALAIRAIHLSTTSRLYRKLWLPTVFVLGYCALEGISLLASLSRGSTTCDAGVAFALMIFQAVWFAEFLPIYGSLVYLLWRFPRASVDGAAPRLGHRPISGAAVCLVGVGLVYLAHLVTPLEPWDPRHNPARYAPPVREIISETSDSVTYRTRDATPTVWARLRLIAPGVAWGYGASLLGIFWIHRWRGKPRYRFVWPLLCAVALYAVWFATRELAHHLLRYDGFPFGNSPRVWGFAGRAECLMFVGLGLSAYTLSAWLAWSAPRGATPSTSRSWTKAGLIVAAVGVVVAVLAVVVPPAKPTNAQASSANQVVLKESARGARPFLGAAACRFC